MEAAHGAVGGAILMQEISPPSNLLKNSPQWRSTRASSSFGAKSRRKKCRRAPRPLRSPSPWPDARRAPPPTSGGCYDPWSLRHWFLLPVTALPVVIAVWSCGRECHAARPCWHWPRHHQFVWSGAPLAGRRCDATTGLGDTIQFIRFAAPLRRLASRVIVWALPALMPLIADAASCAAAGRRFDHPQLFVPWQP